MKLALISIPSGCLLAVALDQLSALQHSSLVQHTDDTRWNRISDANFVVAPADQRIDIAIRDDHEIAQSPPVEPEPRPVTFNLVQLREACRTAGVSDLQREALEAAIPEVMPF